MAKVTMPQLGESVAEGTIGKWLKKIGDDVALGRAAARGHHRQGQRRGPVAVCRHPARDPGRGGADGPVRGRDRGDRGERPGPGPLPVERARRREGGGTGGPCRGSGPCRHGPGRPGRRRRPLPPPAPPPPRPPRHVPVVADQAGDPDARMTPAVRMLMREHGLSPAQIVGYRPRRPDHSRGRAGVRRAAARRQGQPRGREPPLRPARPPPLRRLQPAPRPGRPEPCAGPGTVRTFVRRLPPSPGNPARTRSSCRTPRCAAASPPR